MLTFSFVNLCGIKWVARLAVPIATASASLAFISALSPILVAMSIGHSRSTITSTTPFEGWFGNLTAIMAGLYLVGFAAPAFEAAACHVGETKDPNRNVPRAMSASAIMAEVYFIVLPVVWLGVLGLEPLGRDLATVLGRPSRRSWQLRQGRRHLVHHAEICPRHAAALGGRRAHDVPA